MNYLEKTDEELIALSNSDTEALCTLLLRYKPLVKSIARRFINYYDLDDLIQEGMIAINGAIKTYDAEKNASFKTFLYVCVSRRLNNVVRGSLSEKNRAVTLGAPLDDAIEVESQDIEHDFITKESEKDLWNKIDTLITPLEKQILIFYLDGLSYSDIADRTGLPTKKVDNTLQKIKKTLKNSLKS